MAATSRTVYACFSILPPWLPAAEPLAPFWAPTALPPHGARHLHEGSHSRPLFRGNGVAPRWGDGTVSAAHGDYGDFRRIRDSEGMVSE